MNDEKKPLPRNVRVLGRELPKILQHSGPVMIFGAKPRLSAVGNARCSNPNESAIDYRADAGIELPVDGRQE
jgi:hypothetical protein